MDNSAQRHLFNKIVTIEHVLFFNLFADMSAFYG